MRIIPKNKKGESMTGWFQGILLVLLIVSVLAIAVLGGSDGMNQMYSKNYSTGLSTSAIDDFSTTVVDKNAVIEGGEVTQTDDGLSLKQTWSATKGIFSLLGSFFSGGFLSNLLTSILGFPAIVGTVVQILFIGGLVFLIIRLFMKVKA